MQPHEWHQKGFRTILIGGSIHLYNPDTREHYVTGIGHGSWRYHDDLTQEPWHTATGQYPALERKLLSIATQCYCHSMQGNLCDFCSGTRTASSRKEVLSKSLEEWIAEYQKVKVDEQAPSTV
ncbi:MAG TPA: hypothetical protein V6C65_14135 [Allocoleopsis sp.]